MSDRENLFRPIHKGLRSMLYELGSRMQSADFGDRDAAGRLIERLRRDLENSLSNCVLCMLNTHSHHEEGNIFARLTKHDDELVRLVMKEHHEIARRIREISRTCEEVLGAPSAARRIEIGDRLNLETNDLFVYYLAHLNNEEAILVPVLWERFSDEELRQMRSKFYDALPLPLFDVWLRWTLPSMNVHELITLYSGLKTTPSQGRYPDWVRMARATLDLPTLKALEDRVGLGNS